MKTGIGMCWIFGEFFIHPSSVQHIPPGTSKEVINMNRKHFINKMLETKLNKKTYINTKLLIYIGYGLIMTIIIAVIVLMMR